MISVSIIAIVFVSLFRMQSASISLAEAGRFNALAPILAAQVLAKIEKDINAFSETKGDWGQNYPEFSYACDITDVPTREMSFVQKDSKIQVKKITLVITGPSGQTPFQIETWRVVFD